MRLFAVMTFLILLIPLSSVLTSTQSQDYIFLYHIKFQPLPKISWLGAPPGSFMIPKGGYRRVFFVLPPGARGKISISPKSLAKYFEYINLNTDGVELLEVIGNLSHLYGKSVEIKVEAHYSDPNPVFLPEGKLEILKEMAANPEAVVVWYRPIPGPPGYLIITSKKLEKAFQAFANYKELQGFKVYLITVEEINNTFEGKDLPQKIRNCIRYYFDKYKISFVLLGGDFRIIPPRYFDSGDKMEKNWVNPKVPSGYVPTDYYYAALEGSWDQNHNGVYLELKNGEKLPELDYIPDVLLGRLPVNSSSQVYTYLRALIKFNSQVPYMKSWGALLLSGILDFPKNGIPGAYGSIKNWYLMHYIFNPSGIKTYFLSEQDGLMWSPIQGNGSPDDSDIYPRWSNNTLFLNVVAHGYPNFTATKVWVWDNGDKIPEDTPREVIFRSLVSVKMLNDFKYLDKWPIVAYLSACYVGALDWGNETVSAKMIDNGEAVAVIASTRVEYFLLNWRPGYGYNDEINYCFWYLFVHLHLPIAAALEISRSRDLILVSTWQNVKTALECILLGDPSLSLPDRSPHYSSTFYKIDLIGGSAWEIENGSLKEVSKGGISVDLSSYKLLSWNGSVPDISVSHTSFLLHIYNGSSKVLLLSSYYPVISIKFQVLRGITNANVSFELCGRSGKATFSDIHSIRKHFYNRTFSGGIRYWTTGTSPHVLTFVIKNGTYAYDNGLPVGKYNRSLRPYSLYLIASGSNFTVRIYWIYLASSTDVTFYGAKGSSFLIWNKMFTFERNKVKVNLTRENFWGPSKITLFNSYYVSEVRLDCKDLSQGLIIIKVLGGGISPYVLGVSNKTVFPESYINGSWVYFMANVTSEKKHYFFRIYGLNGNSLEVEVSLRPNAPPPTVISTTPAKEDYTSRYLRITAKVISENPLSQVYCMLKVNNSEYILPMYLYDKEYVGSMRMPEENIPFQVEYKIVAVDSFGRSSSTNWLKLTVTDLNPPSISCSLLSEEGKEISSPYTGEKVEAILSFYDSSGIKSCKAWIPGENIEFRMKRISEKIVDLIADFQIPLNATTLRIYTVAEDSFGNVNQTSFEFSIRDVIPPKIVELKVLGKASTGGNVTLILRAIDNIGVSRSEIKVIYKTEEGNVTYFSEKSGEYAKYSLEIPNNCLSIEIFGKVWDISGNCINKSVEVKVQDTIHPKISLEILGKSLTSITLRVTAKDNIGIKEIRVNGKAYYPNSSKWSGIFVLKYARVFPVTINVSAEDYSGNLSFMQEKIYSPSYLFYLIVASLSAAAITAIILRIKRGLSPS